MQEEQFDLKVTFRLPIDVELTTPLPRLMVSGGVPVGREAGIRRCENKIDVTLWLDAESFPSPAAITTADATTPGNIGAGNFNVEIFATNIPKELAAHMEAKPVVSHKRVMSPLDEEYGQLAFNMLVAVFKCANKVIQYARAETGQYWLREYPNAPDGAHFYFHRYDAHGTINDGQPFRFHAPVIGFQKVRLPDPGRSIRKADWTAIREHATGDRSVAFAGELLARSEQLMHAGYSRIALTEAITALEITLANFSRSKSAQSRINSHYGKRLGVESLQKQIQHFGINKSVNYLLPLLIPENILPTKILKSCQAALDDRNNVVHGGQKQVENVSEYIHSIRGLCKVLRDFTDD